MPTQINKPATGFLGMVEAKQMGRTPAALLDEVVGMVDMFPFWETFDLTHDVLVGANLLPSAGAQTIASWFVPDGEAWIPVAFSADGLIETTGGITQFSLDVSRPPRVTDTSQQIVRLAGQRTVTSVVDDEFNQVTYSWPQRVLYPPGMNIVASCRFLVGSNLITNRGRLSYWRIPL